MPSNTAALLGGPQLGLLSTGNAIIIEGTRGE